MDIALATNEVTTVVPRSNQQGGGARSSNFAQNRPQNRVGGGNFRGARGRGGEANILFLL